jgi:hypothetical protein
VEIQLMQSSEDSPLAPFDPEPERTLFARKRAASEASAEDLETSVSDLESSSSDFSMGDKKLRDLWIPKDQINNADVIMPAIQANNWEIKPALINMVQHNPFKGSALESPHEHMSPLRCSGSSVKYLDDWLWFCPIPSIFPV